MKPRKPIKYKNKPWGYEIWIHNSKSYCGKILVINKSKSSSFHYHKLKDETFYLKSGKILMEIIDINNNHKKFTMIEGDILDILKGYKHKFTGIAEVSEIFEISTQHFDNDSIQLTKES